MSNVSIFVQDGSTVGSEIMLGLSYFVCMRNERYLCKEDIYLQKKQKYTQNNMVNRHSVLMLKTEEKTLPAAAEDSTAELSNRSGR